jgi:serine protease Do
MRRLGAKDLHGVIVAGVQRSGPAAGAGLTSGDVITKLNGEPVNSASELTRKIHDTTPGSSVELALVRKGKESAISVTLAQMPNETTAPAGGQK